jgi:hypothetical protein
MRITSKELNKISDILKDIGQVFFAALLVGPLVLGDLSFVKIISGLFFSVLPWYYSVEIINFNLKK